MKKTIPILAFGIILLTTACFLAGRAARTSSTATPFPQTTATAIMVIPTSSSPGNPVIWGDLQVTMDGPEFTDVYETDHFLIFDVWNFDDPKIDFISRKSLISFHRMISYDWNFNLNILFQFLKFWKILTPRKGTPSINETLMTPKLTLFWENHWYRFIERLVMIETLI